MVGRGGRTPPDVENSSKKRCTFFPSGKKKNRGQKIGFKKSQLESE